MNKLTLCFCTSVIVLVSSNSYAHHAFSATFVKDQKMTVQGVVTKFNFKNPHVLMYYDVTNEDGSVTSWVSEGNSATLLRRSGWDKNSFKPGDTIKVTGDSSRDGSPMTSIDFVEIVDPESEQVVDKKVRNNSLELYRPEVAESVPLKLDDGRPNLNSTWTIQYRGEGPPPVPAVPLNETGAAIQAKLDLADDPQIFCDPPGLARQAVTHHPTTFTLNDDHVVIQYEEFAGYRKIYFDDRAAIGVPTHLGDSVARYEGDKLIIETTNLLSNLTTTEGNRLSDQATIIESYSRVDQDHDRTALGLNIIVSDPLYLKENLVVNKVLWDAGTNYEMLENDCHSPLRERNEVNPAMNYFVPSSADLDSQDEQCQSLAATIKQGDKQWYAYTPNAEANISNGPWYNAKGELLAKDSSELLDSESGEVIESVKTTINERGIPVSDTPQFYCLSN